MRQLVYISDPIHPSVLNEIRLHMDVAEGYGAAAVDYESVADRVAAVLLRNEAFDARKIAQSPRLRIIARHGVGVDNVDLAAAEKHGIWVTTTPGANSQSVAEHVFGLALAAARRIIEGAAATASGRWAADRATLVGVELQGRTLGIVGFGDIGRRVANIAQGFGMAVIVADPFVSAEVVAAAGGTLVDLDSLLAEADVVTLHVPLVPATHGLIDRARLRAMRTGAILVNTSRGGLIDEDALREALISGTLAAAALDVIDAETEDPIDPLRANRLPIAGTPNLLVTPHIAGQTGDALLRMGRSAWLAIDSVLSGGHPEHTVATRRVPQADKEGAIDVH